MTILVLDLDGGGTSSLVVVELVLYGWEELDEVFILHGENGHGGILCKAIG